MDATKRVANFIYFITDTEEEELTQVKNELRDAGIEPDDIPEIISGTIRRSSAEYKIERGKKFKSKFYKAS